MDISKKQLPESLRKIAVFPEDEEYLSLCSNCFRVGKPGVIFMAKETKDISNVLVYVSQLNETAKENVKLSLRSGGHGITMTSVNDGGVILDISQLNKIEVLDEQTGHVLIQAGAVWGDIAQVLNPHRLVISSGDFGDTGAGGLATSGGLGLLVRSFGLTIDHVIGVHLITADGKMHWVDKEHHPELFWAIRGGGGQVGVVTDFLIQAEKVEKSSGNEDVPIVVQTIQYTVADLTKFIMAWEEWTSRSTRKLTSLLMLNRGQENQILVQATNIWFGLLSSEVQAVFDQSKKLATVLEETRELMEYSDFVRAPHEPHRGQEPVYVKNTLVREATPQLSDAIQKALTASFVMGIELRAIDGAINDFPEDFNAWAFRKEKAFLALWAEKEKEKEAIALFQPIEALGTGVYGAYSSDLSHQESQKVWPKETGKRLKEIVAKYDPKGLFNQNRRV